MRNRVRFILKFWVSLLGSALAALAASFVGADLLFPIAFIILIAESCLIFAIWRTQPTFRKLVHWASAGLWPRDLKPPVA